MAWDATAYDALPLPHVAWGAWVVEQLDLQGVEHVLDVGCGTGRDLAAVLDAHPGVTATALDPSAPMLEQARARLAPFGDRVRLVHGDVTRPIGLDRPADAVMSVAALHWVADHEAAFAQIHDTLAPGGRLVVDCGGHGNIARTNEAIAAAGADADAYVHFATDTGTRERLQDAGFVVDEVALVPDDAVMPDRGTFERYLATVILGQHLAELDEDAGRELVRRAADGLPDLTIDYVRLRVRARRAD